MNRNKIAKMIKTKKNPIILTIFMSLFLAATVGGTIAYLIDTTGMVTNTFTTAKVEITPNEKVSEKEKSDIYFSNNSDVPVYIRSTLEIYWTDTIDGKEHRIPAPLGATVDVPDELGADWFKVGEIFYYGKALNPSTTGGGKVTSVMLSNSIKVTNPSSTAICHIDVRYEAIQAEPTTAVEEAWLDVDVENGVLKSASTSGN